MSSLPTSEFELPDEDLTITVNRKNKPSFTVNIADLQLIADSNYDEKIEYTQVLKKIQESLKSLLSIDISLSQVEWLYLKKKEIEVELKKSGSPELGDSDTTTLSQPSLPPIPLDQWVDETPSTS